MDLLKKKAEINYNNDIKNLVNILKFYKTPVGVKGSYALQKIKFYGDYDLFSNIINLNFSEEEIYNEFSVILRRILENINTYFIEFKIQNKDGSKFKFLPNQEFTLKDFKKNFSKNTEYCKIDLVYYSNNRFIEVSCNYYFNTKQITEEQTINELNENIKVLKKENDYFKVLKRLFNIYKIKGKDESKLLTLINFFNSEDGLLYAKMSNADAIKILEKYYDDALTKKRIEVNLDELNYNKELYNKFSKKINKDSKELYKKLT